MPYHQRNGSTHLDCPSLSDISESRSSVGSYVFEDIRVEEANCVPNGSVPIAPADDYDVFDSEDEELLSTPKHPSYECGVIDYVHTEEPGMNGFALTNFAEDESTALTNGHCVQTSFTNETYECITAKE